VVVPGLFATGWIKRGPTGIIGTNKPDAVATVQSILADLASLDTGPKPGHAALAPLLTGRRRVVSYRDWQAIDAAEIRRGLSEGKPREKFTRVDEMLRVLP
jgi:ferredoxin--NADP+ reductase